MKGCPGNCLYLEDKEGIWNFKCSILNVDLDSGTSDGDKIWWIHRNKNCPFKEDMPIKQRRFDGRRMRD